MTLPPPTTDTPDVDPVQNGADLQLLFTAMPAGSELSDKKAKSGDEISPYGCFLNAYHPGESEPYRYWSVYLHYPEPIAEEAGDRKASYKYRLKDSSDKVYLLANCVIPATQNAANLVDRLLRESLSEYESSSTVAKSNLAPQPVNTSDDRCSQPNDEGFSCKEGFCWLNDEMNSCCGFNPLGEYECGLPEAEVVAEIEDCIGDDCGGGSGLPWPSPPPAEDPSDPNPWEPIIPGGSYEPCETCNPGEDPDDDEQTCPLGQIDDGFGNCIDEEGDPEPLDCMGEEGGLAYVDACGICVEGTSSNIDCCATLQKILDTISESEGTAYTDDPDDPGGKTKHGIAWKTWQNYSHLIGKSPTVSNLQNLTRADADVIYENTFWIWSQADRIADGDLRKMYFDFFVNAPSAAVRALQQALYDNGYMVSIDGKLGSETWSNIDQAFYDGKIMSLYNSFKSARIEHYIKRSEYKNNQKYLNGWLNRANKFENKTTENLRGVTCNV